ncbi:MAG: protease modulator HflK, partial [Limnohabitans sp.]
IVAQAEGDAQRFKAILPEYQKAPQVTRDRLYTETFQQVYSNVTKVLVDSKQGSNLLYLPLDKIMQQVAGPSASAPAAPGSDAAANAAAGGVNPPADVRSRDTLRSREREPR